MSNMSDSKPALPIVHICFNAQEAPETAVVGLPGYGLHHETPKLWLEFRFARFPCGSALRLLYSIENFTLLKQQSYCTSRVVKGDQLKLKLSTSISIDLLRSSQGFSCLVSP